MAKFKINGLDKFVSQLEKMQGAADSYSGGKVVSFDDLFSKKFMNKHSRFDSFDEFLASAGISFDTEDEYNAIPRSVFDEAVRKETVFNTWHDMQETAAAEHLSHELGF